MNSKFFLIVTSSFLFTGCSLINGQQFNHIWMGICAAIFFYGCGDKLSVGTPGVPEVDSKTLYVPKDELYDVDASSTNLSASHPMYDPTGISTNYFYVGNDDIPLGVTGTSGVPAKDFVVVGPNLYRDYQTDSSIILNEGNDTVVFEGYHKYDSGASVIDLGPGDDSIVLGSAYINDYVTPTLLLGPGKDKVYIAPIQNTSIVSIVKGEDKIILTGGLKFSDIEVTTVNTSSGYVFAIRMKEKNSDPLENRYINLLYVKQGGGFMNSTELAEASNFEEGHTILDARYGNYLATGSKFPKSDVFVSKPANLIELRRTGYFDESYLLINGVDFNDIESSSIPHDYIVGVTSGSVTMSADYKPFYLTTLHSSLSSHGMFDMDYIQSTLTTTGAEKVYMEISENLSIMNVSPSTSHFNFVGSGDDVFVSHPFELGAVNLGAGVNTIVLNGKRSGNITYDAAGSLRVVLNRAGGECVLTAFTGTLNFYLGDHMLFSDLVITQVGSQVIIQTRDDKSKLITLLKINVANGITLAEINDTARFTSNTTL